MKKAFLLLFLACGLSVSLFAQPRAKKKVSPPPVISSETIKILEPTFDDVLFTTNNLAFEWVNNGKDTVLLPGQLLSSQLDLNSPAFQEIATLKTVFVADRTSVRQGQDDLQYTGTYTKFKVKRNKDLITLTHPKTGEKMLFHILWNPEKTKVTSI